MSQSHDPSQLAFPVYRMIDISPDLAIIPCPGMVVKKVGEDQCALFTPGQSAIDGSFLVDRPWDEVVGEINDELERAAEEAAGYEAGEGEDEDEDEEENSEEAVNGRA